jgi:hypothetical protein
MSQKRVALLTIGIIFGHIFISVQDITYIFGTITQNIKTHKLVQKKPQLFLSFLENQQNMLCLIFFLLYPYRRFADSTHGPGFP